MGGSSKGTVAPEIAKPISTVTEIGSQLSGEAQTFTEEEAMESDKTISKKKMGTRGLQIPMTAPTSNTVSSQGVTI